MSYKRSLIGRRVAWVDNQSYTGIVMEQVDEERPDGSVKTLYCVKWRSLRRNSWLKASDLVVIP